MRPTPALLLVLLLVIAVGCGGGGGDDGAAEDAAAADDGPAEVADAAAEDGADAEPTADDKEAADLTLPDDAPPDDAPPDDADPAGTEASTPADPEPAGLPTDEVPGGRFVEITDITTDGDAYAVAFTPHNFTPLIGTGPEDFHVHFFWDSLEPENAGTNGPSPGEWFLYDGPSPFTGYTAAERPAEATRMCALVADAAHAVTVGTGTCVDLP